MRVADGSNRTTRAAIRAATAAQNRMTPRREAGGEVGAKWFVLSGDVSGRGERERTDTHRITLTLGPVLPDADEREAPDDGESGTETAAGVVGPAIAGVLPEDAP